MGKKKQQQKIGSPVRKELQYSKSEMVRLVGRRENGEESWIAGIS